MTTDKSKKNIINEFKLCNQLKFSPMRSLRPWQIKTGRA